MCVYVYVYVYIYIHMYRSTNRYRLIESQVERTLS